MKNPSSIPHPHVVSNLYDLFFLQNTKELMKKNDENQTISVLIDFHSILVSGSQW